MKGLIFPANEGQERILPYYLAAEEWLASMRGAESDWFFAWQVPPTVICGRHQDMALEVDMDYARAHNINVWRRKSGGGCVYADRHNIMFSYITARESVQGSFGRYTALICRMLAGLGIEAEPTGRNDVAIGGRKVAGNACYMVAGRSIVHGTMLYDADFATMSRVLTPSRAKLASKGVQSVPARVTTLRAAGIGIGCDEFVSHAVHTLCDEGFHSVTTAEDAIIQEICSTYLTPEFLRRDGSGAPDSTVIRSRRFDGTGEVTAHITPAADGRVIGAISLTGDFFGSPERTEELCRRLNGAPLTADGIRRAVEGFDTGGAITGLTSDNLCELLTVI